MIQKNIGIGTIIITDSGFGHVGVGDDAFLERFNSTVAEDRYPQLGIKRIAWMDQVHSPDVKQVEKGKEQVVIFPETDGLFTSQIETMLITKTADCVPILLWSEEDNLIAALHCGWRGFFRGIIESFVGELKKKLIDPSSFSAFLGPHLRVSNFEVKDDFLQQVPKNKKEYIVSEHGSCFYDMTRAVFSTLEQYGITHIEDSGIDTYNNPKYFSYRTWSHTPETTRKKNYSTFANCIVLN